MTDAIGAEAAHHVLQLLERALEAPSGQRRDWLRSNAPAPQLERLLDMLELAEQATNLVPTGALRPTLQTPVDRAGEQLGCYQIRSTLGAGGMGEVYLAERNDGIVNQEVAVKVIGLAAISERARRQFQIERQILADLQHPAITTLLDGGTTSDGLPYVVMERVSGLPLNRYLEQHTLTLEARLRLFIDVAEAVAYAHRHLIVHGDLKPSNILITPEGRPKLLDFGIARSLAPGAGTDGEAALAGMMTASYASPEQARGESLTVASDIYALGLLLYECLTGQRFRDLSSLSPAALREQLSTQPAVLASRAAASRDRTLARRLEGDLDAIIGQALAIDPAQRYGSVAALCDDLQRYLNRLPVSARGDAWFYRARRFCQRHWVVVAATAVIALSLGVATAVSSTQAEIARVQRDIAAREAATAEDAVEFLQSMLFSANPWEGQHNETTIDDVLAYAESALETAFVDRPDSRVYLLAALSEVFIGRGDMDKGLTYAQQAASLAAASTDISEHRRAAAQRALGRAALEQGDAAAAIDAYQSALKILDASADPAPALYAGVLNDLATSYSDSGDTATAESYYRRALARYDAPDLNDPESHSSALSNLSMLLTNRGELAKAERLLAAAIQLLESSGAGDAKQGLALGNRAGLLVRMDRFEEAEELYREAVPRLQRSLGERHPDTLMMMTSLGYYYLRTEQFEHGALLMSEVLSLSDPVLEPGHPLTAYVQNVAGALYCHTQDFERGRGLLQASLDTRRALYGDNHWTAASSMSVLGECLLLNGDIAAATPLLIDSHEQLQAQFGPDDERTQVAARRLQQL